MGKSMGTNCTEVYKKKDSIIFQKIFDANPDAIILKSSVIIPYIELGMTEERIETEFSQKIISPLSFGNFKMFF
jgi:hypothetical protein